jgi:hypothetical protein
MPCQRCNQERSRDRGPWCAEEGVEPNESLAQCHYASVATLVKVYDRLALLPDKAANILQVARR